MTDGNSSGCGSTRIAPEPDRRTEFCDDPEIPADEAGPFAEDMPQFLDEEYWLRCLLLGDVYFAMESSSGAFRVHAAAASAQNEASGAGIYDRLHCFERLITMLPKGELRVEAIQARNRSMESMARKF